MAPELKVCPLALPDPVFWDLWCFKQWGSSNKQMGHEQGSTVVGEGDGVEIQHPASILGKFGGLWEECGSIVPAALGSSGLTGPSGTTSTCPWMDRPRPERFSATAMAAFYFFSWKPPQVDISQRCPFSLAVVTTLCKALVATRSSLPVVEPSKLRNCITKLPCQIFGLTKSLCTIRWGPKLLPAQSRMGFEWMVVTPNSARLHRTVASCSKSSLSSLPGWPSHSLCPNPGCFPACWILSGYGVWRCPWHPAGMAGQGDPEGRKVSKGLGPSSLWVPVE